MVACYVRHYALITPCSKKRKQLDVIIKHQVAYFIGTWCTGSLLLLSLLSVQLCRDLYLSSN